MSEAYETSNAPADLTIPDREDYERYAQFMTALCICSPAGLVAPTTEDILTTVIGPPSVVKEPKRITDPKRLLPGPDAGLPKHFPFDNITGGFMHPARLLVSAGALYASSVDKVSPFIGHSMSFVHEKARNIGFDTTPFAIATMQTTRNQIANMVSLLERVSKSCADATALIKPDHGWTSFSPGNTWEKYGFPGFPSFEEIYGKLESPDALLTRLHSSCRQLLFHTSSLTSLLDAKSKIPRQIMDNISVVLSTLFDSLTEMTRVTVPLLVRIQDSCGKFFAEGSRTLPLLVAKSMERLRNAIRDITQGATTRLMVVKGIITMPQLCVSPTMAQIILRRGPHGRLNLPVEEDFSDFDKRFEEDSAQFHKVVTRLMGVQDTSSPEPVSTSEGLDGSERRDSPSSLLLRHCQENGKDGKSSNGDLGLIF